MPRTIGKPGPKPTPDDEKLEIAKHICELIATTGKGVHRIFSDPDNGITITHRTFFQWIVEDEARPDSLRLGLKPMYELAKASQAEVLMDEIVDIADDGTNDWEEVENKRTGATFTRLNNEAVQRSKLRIETRQKLAGALLPKKYGQKAELNATVTTDATLIAQLEAANKKVEDLRKKRAAERAKAQKGGSPETDDVDETTADE